MVLTVLFVVYCKATEDDLHKGSRRFRDLPKALNFAYEVIPKDAPLDEKCKRYAVILARSARIRLLHEWSVLELVMLKIEDLEELYREIDIGSLSSWYMSAAEKYRITRLAPPFIELIRCLEKIDLPIVQRYLDNAELQLIVDLYKQVLGQPATKTNLAELDMTSFHPTFLNTIRYLFEGLLDVDLLCRTSEVRPYRQYKSRESSDSDESTKFNSLEEIRQVMDQMRNRRRNLRQRKYRERNLLQQRERSRLTSRRLRMLHPERAREQNRRYKKNYREKKRQQRLEAIGANSQALGETRLPRLRKMFEPPVDLSLGLQQQDSQASSSHRLPLLPQSVSSHQSGSLQKNRPVQQQFENLPFKFPFDLSSSIVLPAEQSTMRQQSTYTMPSNGPLTSSPGSPATDVINMQPDQSGLHIINHTRLTDSYAPIYSPVSLSLGMGYDQTYEHDPGAEHNQMDHLISNFYQGPGGPQKGH